MRTRALERPDAPLARAPFSTRTAFTPREARAQVMLAPFTPPPTTTTSAVWVIGFSLVSPSVIPALASSLRQHLGSNCALSPSGGEGSKTSAGALRAVDRRRLAVRPRGN